MDDEDLEDDEVGELIETPLLTPGDTEIAVGDLVRFQIRHPAFAHRPEWPQAYAFIRAIFPGHQLAYLVEVVHNGADDRKWERSVLPKDILQVWIPDNRG